MKISRVVFLAAAVLGTAVADGQVTLVSQNRSATATSFYNPPQCVLSTTIPANGFDAFDQTFTVQCPGGDAGTAVYHSTLSATAFSVQLGVFATGNAPLSGSSATAVYEVVFDVTGVTPYTSVGSSGQFRLVGPGVDRLLTSSENSVLQPGRYTLSCTLTASNSTNQGATGQNAMTFGAPAPTFTIDWYTMDGGAVMNLVGGPFTVSGTIGQVDATRRAALAGGTLSVTGGFWSVVLPRCDADFNNDSVVNSQDFFDFLSAFFAVNPAADFNRDGLINSQDFFDFLSAFFNGCP